MCGEQVNTESLSDFRASLYVCVHLNYHGHDYCLWSQMEFWARAQLCTFQLGGLGPIKGPLNISVFPLCKIRMRVIALIWLSPHIRGPMSGPRGRPGPAHRGWLTCTSCPHVCHTPHTDSPWCTQVRASCVPLPVFSHVCPGCMSGPTPAQMQFP